MKKYIIILFATMLCIDGFAQKGMNAVGVAVEQEGIGAGAWDNNDGGYSRELYSCHGISVGLKYL